MALKIELKPGERIILGQAIITNGDTRTRLVVEGEANTVAKQTYLAVQLMYLNNSVSKTQNEYFILIKELIHQYAGYKSIIEKMSKEILTGSLYKALKTARELINLEEELHSNEHSSASLRQHSPADSQPA